MFLAPKVFRSAFLSLFGSKDGDQDAYQQGKKCTVVICRKKNKPSN